jgi:hypothetical protein
MMANNAATLPRGHYLVEPYLYDVRSAQGRGYGSLTYIEYGLTDRLTVGAIPTFGYNRMDDGAYSSAIGAGDLNVLAQYGIAAYDEDSGTPAIALMLQQTLPTGRYDRLRTRSADGMGNGAYATTLQLNTQTYLWLPNGRILRMRLNAGHMFQGNARVHGSSVYGTSEDFHGIARPGDASFINAAWEYSLTQRWVLALDLSYRWTQSTRIRGDGVRTSSPRSETLGIAPAIEYNWSSHAGVLLGVRVFTGHRSPTTVTPAIALNYAH